MDRLWQAGAVVGACGALTFAMRGVAELMVILWSLRADEAGRKHALALLRILTKRRDTSRTTRRAPPGRGSAYRRAVPTRCDPLRLSKVD
jgi:hypothetical protein